MRLEEIEDLLGIEFHPHQVEFLNQVPVGDSDYRACLYYRTGAGKTLTSLAAIARLGHVRVLVVAPPSTHDTWAGTAEQLGITVDVMSHQKFRMRSTQVSRHVPIIADEFHMFGGTQAQGWKKLEVVARGLKAPLLLLSATPNYNDAERVYCVQKLLDLVSVKGGYLQFLYDNCTTEQDPFSMTPKVTGFREHPDAASYLASLPHVFHLPDEREVAVTEVSYLEDVPEEMDLLGYNRRDHRMIASIMEMRHARRFQGLVNEDGEIRDHVRDKLAPLVAKAIVRRRKVLVYCNHASIAEAAARMYPDGLLLTGKNTTREKQHILTQFRKKEGPRILIGTAALATGTDGLDRVCDTLIILDDTEDDALRRQLIGRILPRGDVGRVEDKKVVLFTPI